MSQQIRVKIGDKVEGVVEKLIENNVIGRKEVFLKLFHIGIGTPSRKEIRAAVAKALSVPEDLIVIRKIFTTYGTGISNARIHVYNSKEILMKFEPKYLIDRDQGTKQKKGGGGGGKGEQKS
ncbi:MAG: 30S ribosomal protein S24e [Sulfolobaceae archaeon]